MHYAGVVTAHLPPSVREVGHADRGQGPKLPVSDELREHVAKRFRSCRQTGLRAGRAGGRGVRGAQSRQSGFAGRRGHAASEGGDAAGPQRVTGPPALGQLSATSWRVQVKRHRDKRRKRRETRAASGSRRARRTATLPGGSRPPTSSGPAGPCSDGRLEAANPPRRPTATLDPCPSWTARFAWARRRSSRPIEQRVGRINAFEEEMERSLRRGAPGGGRRAARARPRRREPRRPAVRDASRSSARRAAHDGHAPLRRPADRRDGAPRRLHRRDEDRRRQDAHRDAARWCSTRWAAAACTWSPSTTTWPGATRCG